jgi:hypothetical protein
MLLLRLSQGGGDFQPGLAGNHQDETVEAVVLFACAFVTKKSQILS